MSGYPGAGHHHQQNNGYPGQHQQGGYQQGPPPPQQYNQYGPPQPQYGGPPPPQQYNQGPGGYGGGYGGPPQGPPPGQYHGAQSYGPPPGASQQQFNNYPRQEQGHNQYGPPSGPAPHQIPTGQQHYGPQFQGQGGQQQQPYFQYSNCTGKKKALLIGINYKGTSAALAGCINDAHNVKNFLMSRYHYKLEDMVILTDDARDSRQMPTRQNILTAMQWLVRGAAPNDSLFFHYSGHGGQTQDLDGDEDDGNDETIYPCDFKQTTPGHIVDDEMHAIMVRPLPAGCRLTAIFDSCHSGSALDLPYIYSTEGKIKEPNLLAEAGQGILGAGMSYLKGDMGGMFKGAMNTFKQVTSGGQASQNTKQTKTSAADVISWSGCKDSQTSADTSEAGKATGAMSYAFIAALSKYPNQSFQQLLNSIRNELKGKYDQKPQLSSSHPMDTDLQFIC
ncbi:caspase domain-containing protein [Mrakia frigida]|uniref:Ca(2+)-dependent cysteine protease MCA1 n=1 Tax=Mrakia frigida TaxID=29902 RepID=UPI003FCC1AEC